MMAKKKETIADRLIASLGDGELSISGEDSVQKGAIDAASGLSWCSGVDIVSTSVLIAREASRCVNAMEQTLLQCESPIESAFVGALITVGLALHGEVRIGEETFGRAPDTVEVLPQFQFYDAPDETYGMDANTIYRVDVLIRATHEGKRVRPVVVELDGHEFHQKTKEQVSRDNTRDRWLIRRGYIVLRFSGAEVWASPAECAKATLDVISAESARG